MTTGSYLGTYLLSMILYPCTCYNIFICILKKEVEEFDKKPLKCYYVQFWFWLTEGSGNFSFTSVHSHHRQTLYNIIYKESHPMEKSTEDVWVFSGIVLTVPRERLTVTAVFIQRTRKLLKSEHCYFCSPRCVRIDTGHLCETSVHHQFKVLG